MTVVTRFAPSPTGFLHIGGARTALFNWLYTRHKGGKFLLRIEDTDRVRSTQAAVDAIFDGLKWLGLDWDDDPVFQFSRAKRHAEVARKLLAEGKAYSCYCSPEELEEMRAEQRAKGLPIRYDGRWRDRSPGEAPEGVSPVIRLKAPREGSTKLVDLVQGEITVANEQLDDMILLRADGTPTYMLSVVVDDHDMNVTTVIRGDDHLTNTFRQIQLLRAANWDIPQYAHIPLIHGPDGAKLSKRHGALGAEAYRDMGFLPEAIRNYLLRLGWGHGDEEIISDADAIAWFDIADVGRAASRFDMTKLTSLNFHYMRQLGDARLAELSTPFIERKLARALTDDEKALLSSATPHLKDRARTLVELAESALFFFAKRPLRLDDKARKLIQEGGQDILGDILPRLEALPDWSRERLEERIKGYAEEKGLKLGKAAQPLRAAVSGSTVSPPLFEVMAILGRSETLGRIQDVAEKEQS
ncbi:glutamate--tRNA ligase 2 [Alphaproteobacteria bacterium]|nr:glutamate--tRNA ligase 2 [Alphaproteobacteria bacterium]